MSGDVADGGFVNLSPSLRLLVVEDNPTDAMLLRDLLSELRGIVYDVALAERLGEALQLLSASPYDLALLDLGLPDSQGLETFVRLHKAVPSIPVIVLTGLEDETVGVRALQLGSQDYLVKNQLQPALLAKAIRYAIERWTLLRTLEETRRKDEQAHELRTMGQLLQGRGTQVSSRIYGGGPLREEAPREFSRMVALYEAVLERALEERTFKTQERSSEMLHDLTAELGRLQASPRDVTEIHTVALRRAMDRSNVARAHAYLEEGRFTVLELMGNLAGLYRQFCGWAHGRVEAV